MSCCSALLRCADSLVRSPMFSGGGLQAFGMLHLCWCRVKVPALRTSLDTLSPMLLKPARLCPETALGNTAGWEQAEAAQQDDQTAVVLQGKWGSPRAKPFLLHLHHAQAKQYASLNAL